MGRPKTHVASRRRSQERDSGPGPGPVPGPALHVMRVGSLLESFPAAPPPPNDTRTEKQHAQLSSPVPCCGCGCTEQLLGCVEQLSSIPSDFGSALRIVRHSSRTVYQVLRCPQCAPAAAAADVASGRRHSELGQADPGSTGLLVPNHISSTMVILATVVFPLMSDCYGRVVELVQKEANAAVDRGQSELFFDLEACGGLWGPLGEGTDACRAYYSNLTMGVESWRTTVRALLRADIHGFDITQRRDDGKEGGTYLYHQPGLCDHISGIKSMFHGSTTTDCEQQKSLKTSPTAAVATESEKSGAVGLIFRVAEGVQQSLNQLALT